MAKIRVFKNIESVSIFKESKQCWIHRKNGPIQLEKCRTVEIRNVDLGYWRSMPMTELVSFNKPVTCHFNAKDEFLFCGKYKVK